MARTRDGMRMAQVAQKPLTRHTPVQSFLVVTSNFKRQTRKSGTAGAERFPREDYSANLMKAVIYSNKPLPELQKWRRTPLVACRTKRAKNRNHRAGSHRRAKGHYHSLRPGVPRKVLRVEFRIDNNSAKFRAKPMN